MTSPVQDPSSIVLEARRDLRVALRHERGMWFHFIEDPLRGTFFRLGKAEYAVLAACDGRRALVDVVAVAAANCEADEPLRLDEAVALAKWLIECGLATSGNVDAAARFERAARSRRLTSWRKINPLFFRMRLGNPDRLLRRFDPIGRALASRPFFSLWLTAVCGAGWLLLTRWPEIAERSPIALGLRGAVQLFFIWCFLKLVHEAGHALACRQVGGAVGDVGVAFILGFPSPFVDVSSVWRQESRQARIFVSLAGVYVETMVAAVAVLVWSCSDSEPTRQITLATAFIAGFSTIVFNLNPFMRFDGYFVLSDLVAVPNLAARAQAELAAVARRYFLGSNEAATISPSKLNRRWLLLYAAISLAWRAFVFAGLASLAMHKFGATVTACLLALPATLFIIRVVGRRKAHRHGPSGTCHLKRAAATWLASSAAAVILVRLCDPRVMYVPAVVEYEPLGVIRAEAAGFVAEVFVADGAEVREGQPLVRLENPDLLVEFEQARLVVQQHLARARLFRSTGAVAKEQAELLLRDAAEAKLADLKERVGKLTVTAPSSGRIVSRGLRNLAGRRITEGDEVVSIGLESDKQLLAALPHSAATAFEQAQAAFKVRVPARGHEFAIESAIMEPRADVAVIHPTLSVENGGEIPVRRRTRPSTGDSGDRRSVAEFFEPHFRVRAVLDSPDAVRLHAGQTAQLVVRTTWSGAASRWWSGLEKWFLDAPVADIADGLD